MDKRWWLRIGQMAASIWALASLVFLLSRLGPMHADELALPDYTDLSTASHLSPQQQQATRKAIQQRFGLDAPVFYFSRLTNPTDGAVSWRWNGLNNQYHTWVQQLGHGQLGTSLRTGQSVAHRLLDALSYSLPMLSLALIITLGLALLLALQLAARPWWRPPVMASLTALQALPLFVVALGLLLLVANPDFLDWFPAYTQHLENIADIGWWAWLAAYSSHAILPVASLILSALPALTLQLEKSLQEELEQPYIITARAKGLGVKQVLRQHALRNALLPLITQLTELLPALVAGAIVIEVIFAVPGMGRLLAEAAITRDYPVLVAGLLFVGAARLLALLLADTLYLWADPRLQ